MVDKGWVRPDEMWVAVLQLFFRVVMGEGSRLNLTSLVFLPILVPSIEDTSVYFSVYHSGTQHWRHPCEMYRWHNAGQCGLHIAWQSGCSLQSEGAAHALRECALEQACRDLSASLNRSVSWLHCQRLITSLTPPWGCHDDQVHSQRFYGT